MPFKSEVDVAIVGAGAAGLAAAHELVAAGLDVLLVEARDRFGGRAWTLSEGQPAPLDLGCGWLHSAERNPWVRIAHELGFHIDKSAPPWARQMRDIGFAPGDYADFSPVARTVQAVGSILSLPVLGGLHHHYVRI